MVKLQVFGNNSKTVSNIKNLTWGKNDQHIKIYLPCNFEVNLITHLQRRRFKCEKLTDGRRMLTHDKSSHGLWPGQLKKKHIFWCIEALLQYA
jgi:hypothetical protein